MTPLKIAIIGTGNIGTDLLIKIGKSRGLVCTLFSGRSEDSAGIARARTLGINCSTKGIDALIEQPEICDVVLDCTSALDHIRHWDICQQLGKPVVDLTPSKQGLACVPAIATLHDVADEIQNINMVTCGGQTTIPIAYALGQVHKDIEYIEVASSVASVSAGPATRRNLDEYVETTQSTLKAFSGARASKVVLVLNPAEPPIHMQSTVYAKINNPDGDAIRASVDRMVERVQQYCPGYELTLPPMVNGNIVTTSVKVTGAGDYLPPYAGNIDIINCAALEVLNLLATAKNGL
jgi:acetaldehyde dehydrogenase (acetylating)